MIQATINKTTVNIPTNWQDITYDQYIKVLQAKGDLASMIHVLTGIDVDTLKKARITNLEDLVTCLSFLNETPEWGLPSGKIGPYKLPKDVTIESLGQFEDLRGLLGQMPRSEKPTLEEAIKMYDLHLEACAIYVVKLAKGEYDSNLIDEYKEELKQYSCAEVMGNGAFFILRPHTIIRNTVKSSPTNLPPQKKKKPALIKSRKSSGSRPRSIPSRKK